jgi:hypothetical protein
MAGVVSLLLQDNITGAAHRPLTLDQRGPRSYVG